MEYGVATAVCAVHAPIHQINRPFYFYFSREALSRAPSSLLTLTKISKYPLVIGYACVRGPLHQPNEYNFPILSRDRDVRICISRSICWVHAERLAA